MANLRTEYDEASNQYREAKVRTAEAQSQLAEAKTRLDTAQAKEGAARLKVEELGTALDNALKGARTPQEQTARVPPPAAAPRINRSVKATVEAFPRDGSDIGLADLRAHFNLSEGAINTRVQKAKRQGLVESSRWGRYRLTEKGLRAVSGLRVVAANA